MFLIVCSARSLRDEPVRRALSSATLLHLDELMLDDDRLLSPIDTAVDHASAKRRNGLRFRDR
jgi:hypothetical protein